LSPALSRRLAAEALGTALLLAVVVGSGIMAERLAGGSMALALLANALATGAALPVLILVFGPISGAHFNPAVTLALNETPLLPYIVAQGLGAVAGVALAHLMFGLPVLEWGSQPRSGAGLWLAEAVATMGLLLTILGTPRAATPYAVGLYITAAYWFTASTSFANPAVTLARGFTTSFAGIAPADVPAFMLVQVAAALATVRLWRWLARPG
jgi:glycerol uptake facilitator-like aquaporin